MKRSPVVYPPLSDSSLGSKNDKKVIVSFKLKKMRREGDLTWGEGIQLYGAGLRGVPMDQESRIPPPDKE
jgi:hypothetical protein